jgi:diguanylate cyclase (GGDEF)-like protein/PAS domain S-box-containing protein
VVGSAPWVNARPDERVAAERAWAAARRSGTTFVVEFPVAHSDGSVRWVQVAAEPVRDRTGAVAHHVGSALDVTEAVTRRTLADRLVGLLDSTSDAVVVFDRAGTPLFANEGARTLVGVQDPAAPGAPAHDAAARAFVRAVRDQMPREIASGVAGHRWEGEVGVRGPDGAVRTLGVVVQIVRDPTGAVRHYSAIARDVTEATAVRRELQHQATHDALTGLPNRVSFLRTTAEAIERARTMRKGLAVLFVDVDGLKQVNDGIGHAVGDQLIVHVARRIAAATRPHDVVARIGGDEFVVLAEGLGDAEVAMEVAERVRAAVAGEVVLQGVEIVPGASVGVAVAAPGSLGAGAATDAALEMLRHADTAMYRAKQRGKGRCELWSEEMQRHARERAALAGRLERALALDELRLEYQPVVSTQTGRIVAVEALLRWHHPERGVLTPPAFLALAEESGLIGPIGDWVVRTACADLRALRDAGTLDATTGLHVNVSRRQLADAAFVERVRTSLNAEGLEPRLLGLEVPEAVSLDDSAALARTLGALARLGVRIGIDDFGSGYSSLSSLRTFPADYLKLDGALVRELGADGGDDPIVRSVVQLAHSLDMEVVAEWVTSEDQLHRLRLLGCDAAQGHLLGAPAPAARLASGSRLGGGTGAREEGQHGG